MAVACYQPRYLPASFKGLAFWCVEADSDHGRRGAEGEFPFSENTAFQDLGRKIRHYQIKAVFRENSHIKDAAAFIRVCESPGPGILVHPTRGAVRVSCKSLKVKDNIEGAQGETTADVQFVEAQSWFAPGAAASGGIKVTLSPLYAAVKTAFDASFDPASVPFYAINQLRDAVASTVETLATAVESVAGFSADQQYFQVLSEMRSIGSDVSKRENPDQVWLAVAGGLSAVDRFGTTAAKRFDAFRRVANWASAQDPGTTSNAGAIEAVIGSVRTLAAGQMAKAATESSAPTLQAALLDYDRVVALMDQEASIARQTCEDGRFLAIHEFMAEAKKAMLLRAYDLPPIVQYDFGMGVSSLVAAYELYGDAKRFGEIERHNANAISPFAMGPMITAVKAGIA